MRVRRDAISLRAARSGGENGFARAQEPPAASRTNQRLNEDLHADAAQNAITRSREARAYNLKSGSSRISARPSVRSQAGVGYISKTDESPDSPDGLRP